MSWLAFAGRQRVKFWFEAIYLERRVPNIPEMGRFFSSVSGALQIATQGRASAQAALQEAEANMRPD